jgi:hypothetical protein
MGLIGGEETRRQAGLVLASCRIIESGMCGKRPRSPRRARMSLRRKCGLILVGMGSALVDVGDAHGRCGSREGEALCSMNRRERAIDRVTSSWIMSYGDCCVPFAYGNATVKIR